MQTNLNGNQIENLIVETTTEFMKNVTEEQIAYWKGRKSASKGFYLDYLLQTPASAPTHKLLKVYWLLRYDNCQRTNVSEIEARYEHLVHK